MEKRYRCCGVLRASFLEKDLGIFHREGDREAIWVFLGWWELLLREGFRCFS